MVNQSNTLKRPLPKTQLLALFRTMLRIRRYEERIGELVEQGEIGTPCHLYIGQEAIAAGVCAALRPTDTVWGGHRSHGHYLAKGGSPKAMVAEIMGKATGCARGRGGSMHLIAREVGILGTVPLVAATIPVAVGAAMTARLRGTDEVAVSFFGDGATEEGHFHESVNLAALYKLPVVFVCENNSYASHMPLLERRAKDNITAAAEAHGIEGEQIDGNDAEAVYWAAAGAVARARSGHGPTLLECRTYRWRGHVGPDPNYDVGVRRRDELKDWIPKDPVARCERALTGLGVRESELDKIRSDVEDEVTASIRFAEGSPMPTVDELHKHLFTDATEDPS